MSIWDTLKRNAARIARQRKEREARNRKKLADLYSKADQKLGGYLPGGITPSEARARADYENQLKGIKDDFNRNEEVLNQELSQANTQAEANRAISNFNQKNEAQLKLEAQKSIARIQMEKLKERKERYAKNVAVYGGGGYIIGNLGNKALRGMAARGGAVRVAARLAPPVLAGIMVYDIGTKLDKDLQLRRQLKKAEQNNDYRAQVEIKNNIADLELGLLTKDLPMYGGAGFGGLKGKSWKTGGKGSQPSAKKTTSKSGNMITDNRPRNIVGRLKKPSKSIKPFKYVRRDLRVEDEGWKHDLDNNILTRDWIVWARKGTKGPWKIGERSMVQIDLKNKGVKIDKWTKGQHYEFQRDLAEKPKIRLERIPKSKPRGEPKRKPKSKYEAAQERSRKIYRDIDKTSKGGKSSGKGTKTLTKTKVESKALTKAKAKAKASSQLTPARVQKLKRMQKTKTITRTRSRQRIIAGLSSKYKTRSLSLTKAQAQKLKQRQKTRTRTLAALSATRSKTKTKSKSKTRTKGITKPAKGAFGGAGGGFGGEKGRPRRVKRGMFVQDPFKRWAGKAKYSYKKNFDLIKKLKGFYG